MTITTLRERRSTFDAAVASYQAGDKVSVSIATPKPTSLEATVDSTGRAPVQLRAEGLELWSPEHPRLYNVQLKAGEDTLDDEQPGRM